MVPLSSKYLLAVFSSSRALSPLLRCHSVLESLPLVSYSFLLSVHREPTAGLRSIAVVTRLYTVLPYSPHGARSESARRTFFTDYPSAFFPAKVSESAFHLHYPPARLRTLDFLPYDKHGSHEHPLDFFPYDKPTVSLSEVLSPFEPRLPASQRQHERPNDRYPAPDCRQPHTVVLLSNWIE
jgi:hypothetical protein